MKKMIRDFIGTRFSASNDDVQTSTSAWSCSSDDDSEDDPPCNEIPKDPPKFHCREVKIRFTSHLSLRLPSQKTDKQAVQFACTTFLDHYRGGVERSGFYWTALLLMIKVMKKHPSVSSEAEYTSSIDWNLALLTTIDHSLLNVFPTLEMTFGGSGVHNDAFGNMLVTLQPTRAPCITLKGKLGELGIPVKKFKKMMKIFGVDILDVRGRLVLPPAHGITSHITELSF
nr:MAG: matrix protein [Mononegavirales sp.]